MIPFLHVKIFHPSTSKNCIPNPFFTQSQIFQMEKTYPDWKRQRLAQDQQQKQQQQQQLQEQQIWNESEEEDGYFSDDSVDYCLDKAHLYPDCMTAKEIATLSLPTFINIVNQHTPTGRCGCSK
jgi:hypothetical protein